MNITISSIRMATVLLALASAVACSKKEDTPTPTPAPTSGWKMNGATVAGTFRANTASTTSLAVIGEFGTGTTASRIVMQVPRRTGTFLVATPDASVTYSEGSSFYSARPGSGSVVVTSYSANSMAGTFNFTATRPSSSDSVRTISGGAFNVSF